MGSSTASRWPRSPELRRELMRPAMEANKRARLARRIDELEADSRLLTAELRLRLLALAEGGGE